MVLDRRKKVVPQFVLRQGRHILGRAKCIKIYMSFV